ncbi:MAG: heat-shock protein Hsp20 [Betaproteobacteria bacterium]|nr:MAG: heat-shock protein Hsp20 [Betaproteobacteria bacterium]
MPRSPDTDWMWAEAFAMLAQAERMHRQFFRLAAAPARAEPAWEPPADVYEDDREVVVVVAMPGVAAEHVEVLREPGALLVRGHRPLPIAGTRLRVRQLEIPYGRFERRIDLPPGLAAAASELAHGVLVVRLTRGA